MFTAAQARRPASQPISALGPRSCARGSPAPVAAAPAPAPSSASGFFGVRALRVSAAAVAAASLSAAATYAALGSSGPTPSAARGPTPAGAAAQDVSTMTDWVQKKVTLNPEKPGIYLVTKKVTESVPEIKGVKVGMVNLFLQGEGALTINENADPTVRSDLWNALEHIVPGKGAAADRSKTSLVGVSLDVPIQEGRLALGTWQGLYLCEWANSAKGPRDVLVTIQDLGDVKQTRNTTVNAPSRGCHLVTGELEGACPGLRGCDEGVANYFIRHTSASLTVNENADPTVRTDMEAAFNHICPEKWNREFFQHTMEGDDDMPGHVKSTMVGASVTLPVKRGSLDLGTWQGLYINEHRNVGGYNTGHAREVTVTVSPSSGVSKQTTITVTAPSRGVHDITDTVAKAIADQAAKCQAGTVNLCIRHTSASLTVNAARGSEGADLESMLNEVVPERWNNEFFKHTYEGPDDMPGHVKSTLMGASVTVPVAGGKLALGEGQGIYLCEHRDCGGWGGGMSRKITITLQGSPMA